MSAPPLSAVPVRDVDLSRLNTFGVVARAAYFCAVDTVPALRALLLDPVLRGLPRLVLGGGSNVLFTRDYPGLVIHVRLLGKQIQEQTQVDALVQAGAGENWHEFVQWTLAQGSYGLENLSLIPGYVGASPIQNIGAYGVEMQEYFASLDAYELSTGTLRRFSREECAFGYRDSVFKHAAKDRYIVTAVRFRLLKTACPRIDYGELRNELTRLGVTQPSAHDVSTAVCNIRRRKLPDPAAIGNAGSFFKNPIVPNPVADTLAQAHPNMPRYVAGIGSSKLAAGWLIERAGWKGKRIGDAGVHEQHALVLVNHGNASGTQILALAQAIQRDVLEKFAIQLEPEPIIL